MDDPGNDEFELRIGRRLRAYAETMRSRQADASEVAPPEHRGPTRAQQAPYRLALTLVVVLVGASVAAWGVGHLPRRSPNPLSGLGSAASPSQIAQRTPTPSVVPTVGPSEILGPSMPIASSSGEPISAPPVTATVEQSGFRVTLRAAQGRYRAGQPIDISADLISLLPDDPVSVWGPSTPGPIGFSVVQIGGPLAMNEGGTTDCKRFTLRANFPTTFPFTKAGGGWDTSDPYAAYYSEYFHDPGLHLPAGEWKVVATAWFGVGGDSCPAELLQFSASITIEVLP